MLGHGKGWAKWSEPRNPDIVYSTKQSGGKTQRARSW
jgi:hypothetical protein